MAVRRIVKTVTRVIVERIQTMVVRLTKKEKARKTTRRVLTSSLEEDISDQSLADAIRTLTELASTHLDNDELRIEVEYYYDAPGTLCLVGYNQESDEVYNARLKKLKHAKQLAKEKKEKEEKKLMRQLLKKYGKDV
jgi:hypothetical protein